MKNDQKILIPPKKPVANAELEPKDVKLTVAIKLSKGSLAVVIGLFIVIVIGVGMLVLKQFEASNTAKNSTDENLKNVEQAEQQRIDESKINREKAIRLAFDKFSYTETNRIQKGCSELNSDGSSDSKRFLAENITQRLKVAFTAHEIGLLGDQGFGMFTSRSTEANAIFDNLSEDLKVELYVKFFRAVNDVVDLMEKAQKQREFDARPENVMKRKIALFEKDIKPYVQKFEQEVEQLAAESKKIEMQVEANNDSVCFVKNLNMAVECRQVKQGALEGQTLGTVHKVPQNLPGKPLAVRYKLGRDTLGNYKNVAITCTYDVTRKQLLYDVNNIVYKAMEYYGAPGLVGLGKRGLPLSDNPFENKYQKRFVELNKLRNQFWDKELSAWGELYSAYENLLQEHGVPRTEMIVGLSAKIEKRKREIKQLRDICFYYEADLLAANKIAEAFYGCKEQEFSSDRWCKLWENFDDVFNKTEFLSSYPVDLTLHIGWKFANGSQLVISIPPNEFHESLKITDKSAKYIYITFSDPNLDNDKEPLIKTYYIGRYGDYQLR